MMKTYFPEVDIVKGIAILLVILGHSFCLYPINLVDSLGEIQNIIYSFHMPLFFIASGFVFSRAKSMHDLLSKKFQRLFLPWLVFSVLSVALRIIFSSFTRLGEMNVCEAGYDIVQGKYYWFLYSLMGILLLVNIIRNDKVLWGLSLCSVIFGMYYNIVEFSFLALGRLIYYFPFFVFGTVVRRYYGGASLLKKPNVFVWLVLFLLVYVGFMIIRNTWCGISRYMVPLTGSLFVWSIACLCKSYPQKLLIHFGHYSLQYYLNHLLIMLPIYLLASKLPAIPMLQLIVIWLLGILVSWTMLLIQKKLPFFRIICGLKVNMGKFN